MSGGPFCFVCEWARKMVSEVKVAFLNCSVEVDSSSEYCCYWKWCPRVVISCPVSVMSRICGRFFLPGVKL